MNISGQLSEIRSSVLGKAGYKEKRSSSHFVSSDEAQFSRAEPRLKRFMLPCFLTINLKT